MTTITLPNSMRPGIKWVTRIAQESPGSRIAIVQPFTLNPYDDIVFSPQGILQVFKEDLFPMWVPGLQQIRWSNGSTAHFYRPNEPDRIRGAQFHAAWAYRFNQWPEDHKDASGLTAIENLTLATRLGLDPSVLVTA